jgi:ABC-type Fe3+ transport system permease subunit
LETELARSEESAFQLAAVIASVLALVTLVALLLTTRFDNFERFLKR